MNTNILKFPPQSVSESKKRGKKWQRDCIDAAENILDFNNTDVRQTYYNKKTNYDLFNQKINKQDIERICNIHDLDSSIFPDSFRHVGMGNNKINLLVGEEIKRKMDVKVRISSSDQAGINSKEEKIKEGYLRFIEEKIKAESFNEEEAKKELMKLQEYYKYSWQDLKEMVAQKLLMYEYRKQDIKDTLSLCFRDALISAEEIVCIEEVGNEVVFRKVNPLNIFTIGTSDSNRVEDADVIVEFGYYSIGKTIDYFYEYLLPEQIKRLEEGFEGYGQSYMSLGQAVNRDLTFSERFGVEPGELGIYSPSDKNRGAYTGIYDSDGNVRVVRVCWRSRRKLGELTYIDEFGKETSKIVTENYVENKDAGEKIKWFWVNEWWEGTKIASDIYIKVRPLPYTGKSLTNLSLGTPPYVGQFYNVNEGRAQSMMDIMKPLDYSYDIIYWKRDMEIAKHHGNVLAYNLSMIPADWDPDEWMKYVTQKGFMPLDPTNEILKGPSQGKSAGGFNQLTATNLPFDASASIRMYNEMLFDIEDKLGKVSGVSPQREAQVHQSETARGIERSVTQSSHITEPYFMLHNNFKKRALTKLLDVIKYVYKNNPIKAQYILDDMGTEIVSNFDDFAESSYDVHISNTSKDTELFESLKQLTHAAMQTGQATLSDVIDIWQSDSIQSTAKKLQIAVDKAHEREMQKGQQAQEAKAQALQAQAQEKEQERIFEFEMLERKLEVEREKLQNAILLKEMELGYKSNEKVFDRDANDNGVRDNIDLEKLRLQEKKISNDLEIAKEKLIEEKRKNNRKEQIEEKKLQKAINTQKK